MEWKCEPHGNTVADDRPFVPNSKDCWQCWPEGELKRGVASPPRRVVEPCPHLGGGVHPEKVRLLGLDVRRQWSQCQHPNTPLGEYVCPCTGCGPSCAGHPASAQARPVGTSALVTGGIGDWIAVESHMRADDRDRLTAVYYAMPAAEEVERLWRAVGKNYPRLTDHVRLPTGSSVLYDRAGVERHVGYSLPSGVTDLSIRRVFPARPAYSGSSLLANRLAVVKYAEAIPRPWVVVVPHSTWFRPAGRAFDAADWDRLTAGLEREGATGVVLCRDRVPIPTHPRLLDFQGKTPITEAVELLKAADGYYGIDSWCSVLAAKLFPAARMWVKSVWQHGWQNRLSYWSPWATFPFVSARLEFPPWT